MYRLEIQYSVLVFFCLCLTGCTENAPQQLTPADAILSRACAYLWNEQAEDGGWHSATHGLVKSGQAWTPFILTALMDVPDSVYPWPQEKAEAALAFLRKHINSEGAIGLADPDVLEYPNYATAYALRALLRNGNASDTALIHSMLRYLVRQQFTEERGLTVENPAYGCWGFGETELAPGSTGHVDLSHTRRVLEALRLAGYSDSALYRKATVFLRVLQKHPMQTVGRPGMSDTGSYDGGFYFSPVIESANKADRETDSGGSEGPFRSYATATCDGLLALLACGHGPDDEPVRAARRWLLEHPALTYPQGIPEDHPLQWHKVMFFYHLAVRAEAYRALGESGTWRQEMVRIFADEQREDGSFANPDGTLNKEDDPLLATALAIICLSGRYLL